MSEKRCYYISCLIRKSPSTQCYLVDQRGQLRCVLALYGSVADVAVQLNEQILVLNAESVYDVELLIRVMGSQEVYIVNFPLCDLSWYYYYLQFIKFFVFQS